jgi:hypothetical protein
MGESTCRFPPSRDLSEVGGTNHQHSDRLQGQWGISDVQDCVLAAQHLSTSLNLIDPSRVFIRGGSAGGYTVLAAISNPPPDPVRVQVDRSYVAVRGLGPEEAGGGHAQVRE